MYNVGILQVNIKKTCKKFDMLAMSESKSIYSNRTVNIAMCHYSNRAMKKIGTNPSHIFKKQIFFKMDRFQEILNSI